MGASKKLIRGGEVSPLTMPGVTPDVTAAARLAELEERSQLLEMVLEATHDGIWDWNLATGRIVYSARWKAMLGYADHELPNEPDTWKRVIHPDDYQRVRDVFKNHLEGSAAYSHLSRFVHKDGSVRWMMVRATSTRDANDRVLRMVGNHTDVTEIKAAQEGLALQEKLLAVTGRIAGVGGWELDVDTGHTRWTEEVYRIYELPDHTETDVDMGLQCFPEPGRSQILLALQRAVKDGVSYDLEVPFVTTAGHDRWVRVQCYPEMEDGVVRRIFGTIHDVTRERQTQLELAQALETARAASEAKARFFKSISHEMRTPLQGILGMAEVLPGRTAPEDIAACSSTIRRSGEALLTVINDVLAFTDADAGRVRADRAPVEVREVVDTVVDLVSAGANAKSLELLSVVEGAVPRRFVGDSRRMRQVLLSLLSNAVKFTNTGCVVVDVGVTSYRCLRIAVSDTGVGMTDAQAQRVFEPMEAEVQGGGMSGLSLATSARVISALGGRMGVRPRPVEAGGGSVFWFEVPLGDRTEPFEPSGEVTAYAGRAVVVHGDELVRAALGRLLAEAGLRAEGFSSARRAMEALAPGRVDNPVSLIVADGAVLEELQQALREATRPAARPGVMVLTYPGDTPGEHRAGVSLQAVPFDVRVQKPVRQGEFLRAVRTAMAAAQLGTPPAGEPAQTPEKRPLRVLVADDNATNRRVLQLQLESLGLQATFVHDGAEAVSAVQEGRVDLVLMDVMMPTLGGVEATAEIRGAGRMVEQPMIVGVTAAASSDERALGVKAGMDDYLAKPVSRGELERVLAVARARRDALDTERIGGATRVKDTMVNAVKTDRVKAKEQRAGRSAEKISVDEKSVPGGRGNESSTGAKSTRKRGGSSSKKRGEPPDYLMTPDPDASDASDAWMTLNKAKQPERIGSRWPVAGGEQPWWAPVEDLLDVPGLTVRLGGDEHFVRSVLRTYCSDAPVQMNALAQACRSSGWREIRAAAHAVKGAALNIGLGSVARMAHNVEAAARTEDATGVTRGVEGLEEAFESAMKRLRQLSMDESRG